MSKADKIKEKIGYLKVWLSIFVLTGISLIGWMVTSYETAKNFLIVLDSSAIFVLILAILMTHKTINRKISELEDL